MTVTGIVTPSVVPPPSADSLETARELLAQATRHEATHEWEPAIELLTGALEAADGDVALGTRDPRPAGGVLADARTFSEESADLERLAELARGRGIGRPRLQRTCAGRVSWCG